MFGARHSAELLPFKRSISGRELTGDVKEGWTSPLTPPQLLATLTGAWYVPFRSVFTVVADPERNRTLAPLRLTGLSYVQACSKSTQFWHLLPSPSGQALHRMLR
jgi:hypothetical protein